MNILTLQDVIFGDLQDVYQGLYAPRRMWQSEMRFNVFRESVRVGFETTDELGIQEFHYQAYEEFKLHQAHYKASALKALLEFYLETILPLWQKNGYFGVPELAPALVPSITEAQQLEGLLSYPSVYLHPPRDGTSSLGLSFECTWDVEHGVGVLLREGQVLAVGSAEVATYDYV